MDHQSINVDTENTDKNTPLHYFSSKFIVPSCVELGERLIEMGMFEFSWNFFLNEIKNKIENRY